VKLLLDTHILLWAAYAPEKIPPRLRYLIEEDGAQLFYSPISLWEIAIKQNIRSSDLDCNLPQLRDALNANRSYAELTVSSRHALYIEDLPHIHNDPFDRMLIAQSRVEEMLLVTVDRKVRQYLSVEKDFRPSNDSNVSNEEVDRRVRMYLEDRLSHADK
jgi:PIN domain nuclease of toxin-antitoxin system